MMIHILALSIDGIIHTMVAIIQPETMPLANIWPGVLHDLAADLEEGMIGLGVEDRQVQHHVGHQQRAAEVAHQHHAPQPQQPPDIGPCGFAHHRQYGGEGVSVNSCWRARITAKKPAQ
jgi:hypothetical protein